MKYFKLKRTLYQIYAYLDNEALTKQPGITIPKGRYLLAREITALTGTNKDESMKGKTKPTAKKKNSAKGKSTKKK